MTDITMAKTNLQNNLHAIVVVGAILAAITVVIFIAYQSIGLAAITVVIFIAYQSIGVGSKSAQPNQVDKVNNQVLEVMAMPKTSHRKAYLADAAHVLEDGELTVVEYRYMQSNYKSLLAKEISN